LVGKIIYVYQLHGIVNVNLKVKIKIKVKIKVKIYFTL